MNRCCKAGEHGEGTGYRAASQLLPAKHTKRQSEDRPQGSSTALTSEAHKKASGADLEALQVKQLRLLVGQHHLEPGLVSCHHRCHGRAHRCYCCCRCHVDRGCGRYWLYYCPLEWSRSQRLSRPWGEVLAGSTGWT
jgi:hypothetical protein